MKAGQIFRRMRSVQGLSQEEFARRGGISRSSVQAGEDAGSWEDVGEKVRSGVLVAFAPALPAVVRAVEMNLRRLKLVDRKPAEIAAEAVIDGYPGRVVEAEVERFDAKDPQTHPSPWLLVALLEASLHLVQDAGFVGMFYDPTDGGTEGEQDRGVRQRRAMEQTTRELLLSLQISFHEIADELEGAEQALGTAEAGDTNDVAGAISDHLGRARGIVKAALQKLKEQG